jgi:hypothetical protein
MRQNSARLFRPLTCALLVLLSWCYGVGAQRREYHYLVRGRVVNSKGKPIPGAIVYLDPIEGADQIFGNTTDANGNFRLEENTSIPRKLRRLYVTSPPPSQVAILIRPPYNLLPRLRGRKFGGKQLIMSPKDIDIGDVEVQIRYGVADVRLNNCAGNPLFTKQDEWRYLWFRFRDQSNRIVKESTLSQNDVLEAVDFAESTIALALPEGVWRLDISPNGADGPWIRSKKPVVIRGDIRQHLTLQSCESNQ